MKFEQQSPYYCWRPLRPEDASALYQLEIACAAADGHPVFTTLAAIEDKFDNPDHARHSLCALADNEDMMAAGWLSVNALHHEYRILSFRKAVS